MVGEHIRVLKGGRWVHAVDCGDETVLHLVESAPPPRVRRAYRPEFVAGAGAVEVVTHRERTFPRKEIVRRAYSRASDPALASMFRDSEAFVEWCTTGRLPGSHHVALENPGVAAAPAKGAPARPAAKTRGKTKASARKPAAKATARRPARPKAKSRKPARPAAKAKRRAQRKPARAKAPARRGRKPARRARR